MKVVNMKWYSVILLLILVLQSCNTDDSNNEPNTNTPELSDPTSQLIVNWNNLWLEIDRYSFGMRPNSTARSLAYIHLAAYETCVNDMDGYASNTARYGNLLIDNSQLPSEVNINLALNSCYAKVFNHFMINTTSEVDGAIASLKSSMENRYAQEVSTQVAQESQAWGNYVADQVIAYSQTDTEAESQILEPQPLSYEPPVGDGYWTYSADPERALFPYWQSVRTFVISKEETSSVPPLVYSEDENSDYFQEMQEVYQINNTAKADDNEDLWIAEFWSDDVEGLMMSPPGRQISIANQLMIQTDIDHIEALELLLKLGFALNDAAVSTWHDKYDYMVMRPNVYIEEFIDPDYETNLFRLIFWPNPSFPSYPSGHSTFSGAAGGVLINTFGNNIDFTDRSHQGRTEFRGEPRQFNSLSDMVEEAAFSRIPLGVHMRMDCVEGMRLGYEISDAVNDFDLGLN